MHHVLVVHGDSGSARAISRAIGRTYEISRSPSVRDALALVAAGHRYDAVVCADTLPDGTVGSLHNGLETRSGWQARRMIPFASADAFLLDGESRDGVAMKRSVALDLIDQLDVLTKRASASQATLAA